MKSPKVVTLTQIGMIEPVACSWREGSLLLKGQSAGGKPLTVKLVLSGTDTAYLTKKLWKLHREQLASIEGDIAMAKADMKGLE